MEVARDGIRSGIIKILKPYLKTSMIGLSHGGLESLFHLSEVHVDMIVVAEKAQWHGTEKETAQEYLQD